MKNLIYLVLFVFIAGFAGCGKTDIKVDKTNETTDIKTKDAEVTTGKLPADWPSDIPAYKDAKVIASAKTAAGTTVTYEINDKAKPVGDFYKSEMTKAGYDAD